ncbi:unnamed protein product [Cylindrotheca closterium]|uniref:CST complex subunit Stn1 N-terminal domain-containing protein n=1 Tax=Cylindrotheca closterium TaxID=2856 RepID=A0AAD2CGF1_9STRA|nr:unnamed protein product [Cylindrotheca closterium]
MRSRPQSISTRLQETTKEVSSCDYYEHLSDLDAAKEKEKEESQDSLIAHFQQPSDQTEGGPSEPELLTTNLPQHANQEDGQEPSTTTHLPQHDANDQQQQQLQGDENFLVGITPQYWAHVPMLIDDILHHLTLSKGGINFLHSLPQHTKIPVSKCLLVGRIIWAKQTSDSAMAYILDDGTGLMDCVCYHNHNTDAVYELPSLLPTSSSSSPFLDDNVNEIENNHIQNKRRPIALGTCVKVFGKIKNLAILQNGRVLREVNAQLIEPVYESFATNSTKNPEHDHWMKCANFLQTSNNNNSKNGRPSTNILQPLGCLEILGDRIRSQVRAKRRLPSADDTLGAWRVFGTRCLCACPESIKESLLYCHCQAKVSVLYCDQQFQYRDALLKHLLERQTKYAKKLVFSYQDIQKEESLIQVAREQEAKSGDNKKEKKKKFFHQELIRSTVRALAKDGIIYHIDPDNDQYLLITREKVLEPFVRDELDRTGNSKNYVSLKGAPEYLKVVDLEKFMYIKRCIVHENKTKKKKTGKNEAKRQKVVAN